MKYFNIFFFADTSVKHKTIKFNSFYNNYYLLFFSLFAGIPPGKFSSNAHYLHLCMIKNKYAVWKPSYLLLQ